VKYTCTDFTFNSKRAEEDFGFKPKYTEEEAIEITAAFYKKA
jgi:nucleoside-diphosphate-sugar epimerase